MNKSAEHSRSCIKLALHGKDTARNLRFRRVSTEPMTASRLLVAFKLLQPESDANPCSEQCKNENTKNQEPGLLLC